MLEGAELFMLSLMESPILAVKIIEFMAIPEKETYGHTLFSYHITERHLPEKAVSELLGYIG